MLDQEDLGGKEDLGRRRALQSTEPLRAWIGAVPWTRRLPSLLPLPLPPSLPPASLLPSYSPPLLSLSGSLVPSSGCSDSQSSTRLLEGPWGKGVWPAFHLLPHQHLFPQSLAWKHAVPGASFVTNGEDKISSLLSPPNKPHQTAQPHHPLFPHTGGCTARALMGEGGLPWVPGHGKSWAGMILEDHGGHSLAVPAWKRHGLALWVARPLGAEPSFAWPGPHMVLGQPLSLRSHSLLC